MRGASMYPERSITTQGKSMSEFAVELRGIRKKYGRVTAVESIDLAVSEGEFLSFLGPSGCGKTTTLRMIAGLEAPSEGDILIKGQRVNDVPIHKRNIGIVFQNYALFPHRTVFKNVAFGLRYRGCSQQEIQTRVKEALRLVQLESMAERYPAALSGGQQQRVALARAIVLTRSEERRVGNEWVSTGRSRWWP